MPTRSAYAPGTFCWADHQSQDPDAARAFYSELLGWEFEGPMAMHRGAAVAAVLPLPHDSDHPAHWNSYVSVEDADLTAPRAVELGGALIEPPFTVGPAGRLALLQDPGGALVCLWEPGEHPGAGRVNEPGALCWNHLSTPDLDTARSFYSDLLGWTWGEGDVCMVGERLNGSAGPLPPDVPPNWSVVFGVADLERAQARSTELGGSLLTEPAEFGPGRFVVIADPTGAAVSFYQGEYDD